MKTLSFCPQRGQDDDWLVSVVCPHSFRSIVFICQLFRKYNCQFYFVVGHKAHKDVVCWLGNDNLIITLVNMHSLTLFRCHRLTSDHFLSGRDEMQSCIIWCARNLYIQNSWRSYNVSKIIEKYVKQNILLKVINCGLQYLW